MISACSHTELSYALLIMIFLYTFTCHNLRLRYVLIYLSYSISLVVLNFCCSCFLHILCFGVMQVFIIMAFNFWSFLMLLGFCCFMFFIGYVKIKNTCLSMCPCNMHSMSLQLMGFLLIFAFFYFAPFKLFDLSIALYVFVIVLFTMASTSFFFSSFSSPWIMKNCWL